MPIGPFSDWDDCMAHMEERYDEETAKNVCGAMKRDLGGSKVLKNASPQQIEQLTESKKVMSFEDNGRLFMNIFLLDGSVNQNDWGVTPQSIPKNIFSAIGKPLVLYKNTGNEPDAAIRVPGELDHPPIAAYAGKEGDINHALAFQDLFRIGTYIDVYESKTKPGQWYGVAEITDELAKKAIREDPTLPLFVSPTVRLLHPMQADQALSDWEFMHSALVDRPAYGIEKAYINGQCSGDSQTCLLHLKRASIANNNGKYGCGFCTYKAIKQIQNNIKSAKIAKSFSSHALSRQQRLSEIMSIEKGSTTNVSQGLESDLDLSTSKKVSEESTTNTTTSVDPAQQRTIQQQKTMRKISEQPSSPAPNNGEQPREEEGEEDKDPDGQTEGSSSPTAKGAAKSKRASIDELSAKIEALATQKKTLEIELENERHAKAAMETLIQRQNDEIGKYNDRIAALEKKDQEREHQSKLSQITNLVYNSAVYRELNKEAKDKQVETWANSGLSIDKINEIIEPMNANLKKASLSRGGYISTNRVSLGGASRQQVNGAVDFQNQKATPELQEGSNNVKQASVKAHHTTAGSNEDDELGAFSLATQMFPGRS